MTAPRTQQQARLFDGVSARARPGIVHLRDDTLVFRGEDGARDEWRVERVLSMHRVADGLHVEIGASESPSGVNRPPLKLVVGDPAFEAQLDEARARFGAGARAHAGALARRLGVKAWLVIAAIAIPAAWLGYTSALPHAHVLISREAEGALGEKLFQALAADWQLIDDEVFADLSARMIAELADPDAGFDVRVTLVNEEMPNAFAAPGGRIVVFSGLLRICPGADALAGVLAHEIAHVEQRHGLKHLLRTLGVFYFAGCVIGGGVEEFATAETIGELSSWLMVLKHSRDHEREADWIAVQKLRRARRPVSGLLEFFRAFEKEMPDAPLSGLGWISTHPLTADRIAEIERAAAAGDPAPPPWLEPEAWQAMCARILRRR